MSGIRELFAYPHFPATSAFIMSEICAVLLFYPSGSEQRMLRKIMNLMGYVLLTGFVGFIGFVLLYMILGEPLTSPVDQILASVIALAGETAFCAYLLQPGAGVWNKLCTGTVYVCVCQPSYFAVNALVSRYIFPYEQYSFAFTDPMSLCIYFVILVGMTLYLRRFSPEGQGEGLYSFSVSVILISLTGFLTTFLFYEKIIFRDDMYSLITAIVFLSVMGDLSVYYFSYSLSRSYRQNMDLSKLKLRAADEYKSMEQSHQLYENIRTLRHELKNHISLMQIMVRQKEYESLEKYLDELCKDAYPVLNTTDCKHPVIRMLVNNAISMMEMENVRLTTYVSVPEVLYISDTDLCSLLSNLIINAYEAAIQSESPRITLSVKVENDFLFVHVKNSIRESVLAKNPHLRTSKSIPDSHGLGVKAIRRIAAKYNGNVVFSEEEQMFVSRVMLVLPRDISAIE